MIWPWSRIEQLVKEKAYIAEEFRRVYQELDTVSQQKAAEIARRIGAEALAAERKEECQRLREDLAAARATEKEARELMAKTLVDVNTKLTTPLVEKLPDFTKMREMAPLKDPADAIRSRRQFETNIMRLALAKMNYSGFGPKPTAPAVAEENPPGEGERPSLNAVG